MEEITNKDTSFRSVFLKNLYYFLVYLGICSLFLFNHNGGADIVFLAFFVICFTAHVIVVLIHLVMKWRFLKRRSTYYGILSMIILWLLSFITAAYYMDLMWWLTSGFQ